MHVILAINDKEFWIIRDYYWALLYTLLVGTTAHNLSGLLESHGGKSCFIGHNLSLYVYNRCVIVCFTNKTSKLVAIGSVPIFKDVKLHWAELSLACCVLCKQFGHVSDICLVGGNLDNHNRHMITSLDQVCLAKIYKKKQTPVVCPVLFRGKTWAQIAGDSSFCVVLSILFGDGLLLGVVYLFQNLASFVDSGLNDCLVVLKHSLELLMDQVSALMKKLSLVELMSLATFSYALSPAAPVSFDGVCVFISGLDSGYLGAGVVVIMDFFLTKHVYKVSEMPSQLLSIRLFFKNKLSVSVLGFYTGAFAVVDCIVINIDDHFDTDYQAVSVLVSLSGLLDTQLNSLCRQANKDYWKFDFKSADNANWGKFKDTIIVNAIIFSNNFITSEQFLDLDVIWNAVCKIITLSANKIFKKKWFKSFDSIFTKESSRFHKLELLVSKIAKASYEKNVNRFAFLMKHWDYLDNVKASIVQNIVNFGVGFNCMQKSYYASKFAEFL
ncbi:hypothetical protein G9A89_017153 [Geosiphon pyriformis]|nr:hypothetical protein G9A89_017153 [Geosiphon pyriformis]